MTRALLMFARALGRRCPSCGAGPVITRWIHTVPACPRCRLRLDRGEPDYFLGAIVFNMAFAEGLFAAALLAVLLCTWPNPPWDALYYGGIVGLIVAPVLPGISDGLRQLEALFRAAREAGARFVHAGPLRLYPAVRDRFLPVVDQHFPELAERYRRAYARSSAAPRSYAAALQRRIQRLQHQFGFPVNAGMRDRYAAERSAPQGHLAL